ncbi:uncharacterized protein LOC141905608 isoform X2 [Tubulanus polymorphus]|uniref:uncharacterized protein LOC141905608 isoform X2 n=1 Tax=Tubulanus polymorphus TaxID=672921 RepID=UPI003DA3C223
MNPSVKIAAIFCWIFSIHVFIYDVNSKKSCKAFSNISIKVAPDEPIQGRNSYIWCIVDKNEDFCGEPIALLHIRDNVTKYEVNFKKHGYHCFIYKVRGNYRNVAGNCYYQPSRAYGIEIKNTLTKHIGKWLCRYKNTSVQASSYIKPIYGPGRSEIKFNSSGIIRTIKTTAWNAPPKIRVESGKDLNLTCAGADGLALTPIAYFWIRKSGSISVKPVDIEEANESRLIFPAMKTTDAGTYECMKRNVAGIASATLSIEVYCKTTTDERRVLIPCDVPPKLFRTSTLKQIRHIGETAEFRIEFWKVRRFDRSVRLYCEDYQQFQGSCPWRIEYALRNGYDADQLGDWRIRISEVFFDDYGNYKCWLENQTTGLRTYLDVHLLSPGYPSQAKSVKVISVTAESAQISWISLSSRRNQYFVIEYRLVGTANWTVSPVVDVDTGEGYHCGSRVVVEAEIVDLSPSSKYEVRVRGRDPLPLYSVTNPSETITIKTRAGIGQNPAGKSSQTMATIMKLIDSVIIYESAEELTVSLSMNPGVHIPPDTVLPRVTISVLACCLNETTAATPVRCRSFNFSPLIGQMQARIDRNALYRYTIRIIDNNNGDVIYSRHVTAIMVEEGASYIDRDVILIVCPVAALLLFVVLLVIVYSRKILTIFNCRSQIPEKKIFFIENNFGRQRLS